MSSSPGQEDLYSLMCCFRCVYTVSRTDEGGRHSWDGHKMVSAGCQEGFRLFLSNHYVFAGPFSFSFKLSVQRKGRKSQKSKAKGKINGPLSYINTLATIQYSCWPLCMYLMVLVHQSNFFFKEKIIFLRGWNKSYILYLRSTDVLGVI